MYLNKFKENIRTIKTNKIIIAFSGGADSVFLFIMFKNLNFEIELAYMNHNLREDSYLEELFVTNFAKVNKVKLHKKSLDISNISKHRKTTIEETGREERYKFFDEISKNNTIALAHHIDDNVETFLFRLIRGTSLKGLKSIPFQRENIIRPLLNIVWKKEILKYLEKNDLKYFDDYTNNTNMYTRNKIRNELIPTLSEYNPRFKNSIKNLIEEISNLPDLYTSKEQLDINFLNTLSSYEKFEILKKFISQYTNFSIEKLKLILKIIDNRGTKTLDIGRGKILIKRYNIITVEENIKPVYKEIKLELDEDITFKNFIVKASNNLDIDKEYTENYFFNIDSKNLKIRTRLPGDKFASRDQQSSKKLKEYFIDKKIPKDQRDNFILISSGNDILMILGRDISKKYTSNQHFANLKISIKIFNKDLESK